MYLGWPVYFNCEQLPHCDLFFVVGLLSWIFLTYLLFAILIEKRDKPSLKVVNGTWLLLIVATQAVSILSIQLESYLPFFHKEVLFFSLLFFLCGCMFYIIVITLIIYRLIFFNLQPEDFGPPYWINMGADAITVLAGSTLMLSAYKWLLLTEILPFLKGFTLLFWAIGTWWIPLIIILGAWRHIFKKVPLKYNSQYWGMIFPLGMYSVCTVSLSHVVGISFLMSISSAFVFIALGAWTIVFIGLIYSIVFNAVKKRNL